MQMTLGKKIGAGFLVVLALALVTGLAGIRSLNQGADVSNYIASDRVPRLLAITSLQRALLLTGYDVRAYLSVGTEELYVKAQERIREVHANVDKLRKIEAEKSGPDTKVFLASFETEFLKYEKLIEKGVELYKKNNETSLKLIGAGNVVLSKFEGLVATMQQTQAGFLGQANYTAVAQYGQNMRDAAHIYAEVAMVIEKLLIAERNSDLKTLAEVRESLPGIEERSKEVRKHLLRDECRQLFDDAVKAYHDFSGDAENLAILIQESLNVAKERINLYNDLLVLAVKAENGITSNTSKAVDEAASTLSNAIKVMFIMLGVVLVLGIACAIFITRMVVGPLVRTQVVAQAIAAGDLDMELDVYSHDELGMLADDLRTMVTSLKKNISESKRMSEEAQKATEEAKKAMARAEEAARQAENAKREGMHAAASQLEGIVDVISSASGELSAQIEQSDRSAAESSQRLSEAATAMGEMNATVQDVARNAGTASGASSDTKQKAENGARIVEKSLKSINEVHKVSMALKDDMQQLNEHAQSINQIMSVISDIADQTNLLALNAAIEAARAGEAGRGFAVVADEVRKLAEKTMTSTSDVGNAIRAIQESTDKSMASVDNAVQQIDQATEYANESGRALKEIVETVDATADQVNAIAAASEEQSAASEEINRSIMEVNDISRQTADAMAQAAKAVSELASQAQGLTNLIHEMKQ